MTDLRRVVFFGGFRTKIFEWEGKALLGVLEFEPTEEDITLYSDYLKENASVPTALLLDIIEEDFQRDIIPKLNVRDQKAVLQRHLDKHYRDNTHTHYQVQGPSLADPKKIDVLLSSMINPDVFEAWFAPIRKFELPLIGIYSVPYLTEEILGVVGATKAVGENVLVVSRQVRSAVRESFFKGGHLYFSRFAKLPRDQREKNTADSTHHIVTNGTEQVQHFLRNQRIVAFNDALHVFAIVPEWQISDLPQLDQVENRHIHYVSIESIVKKFGLKGCENQHADVLFSYLCSKMNSNKDHYALSKHKHALRVQVGEKVAIAATAIISIFCLAMAGILAIDSASIHKEIRSIEGSTNQLRAVYDQSYAAFETQIQEAETLKRAVELAEFFEEESKINLQSAFPVVGHLLNQPAFQQLHITTMEWEKHTQSEYQALLQESTVEVEVPYAELAMKEEYVEEEQSVGSQLIPVLRLGGVTNRIDLPYRETVQTLQRFISSIRAQEGVVDVVVINLPVDIRPASNFDDRSGEKEVPKAKQIAKNVFQFLIVLKSQMNMGMADEQ